MPLVSGLLYAYYHICPRKVWYVANGISMEGENDDVQIGSLIDRTSYGRERKHILIDEKACIDFMRDNTVYEVKKSSAEKEAAIAQIKYYLFVLHQKGVNASGELRVPKENHVEEVSLSQEDMAVIIARIKEIEAICSSEEAPPKTEKLAICKKCAFYEFCCI